METRITKLLGIKYPIIQGGMAWVAEPPLASAVCEAGGFGIITGSYYTPRELKEKIREMKELTDKPFGVNFTPGCENLEANLEVCIEEGVKAVTYGRGRRTTDLVIEFVKPEGILCFPAVGTLRQALRVEGEGADAVIVSGYEAGGHTGRISTLVLLSLVLGRVKIPVIAAGGFGDGRGIAAALAMGADAVQMGTRFICTKESPAHPDIKRLLLEAREEDTTITGHVTGIRMRCLRNRLTEHFEELERRNAPPEEFERAGVGKIREAFVEGNIEWGSIPCGQIVGLVDDIPSCRELIERMMEEAQGYLKEACDKMRR